MTQHAAAMSSSHGTGDINLASALMAMGIALDDIQPCAIISKQDGKDYGRFFLTPISNCGKFETMKLLDLWTHPEKMPNQRHPFAWILELINSRPHVCRSSTDWLDHAHDHLQSIGELPTGFPRRMDDIPEMIARAPEARASYVLAFVHCRALCLSLVDRARRQVLMSSRDGRSHQIIDNGLPRHVRNNLIARLDG
jgi:hypothetical protein